MKSLFKTNSFLFYFYYLKLSLYYLNIHCIDSKVSYDIKFGYFNYGNELEQLKRYIDIVSFTEPNFHRQEYYDLVNNCEINTMPHLGHRYYTCRHSLRQQMKMNRTDIWNNSLNVVSIVPGSFHHVVAGRGDVTTSSFRYSIDCEYLTTAHSSNYFIGYFNFTIFQKQCKNRDIASFNYKLDLRGGSTFEILYITDSYMTSCNTVDHFDDSYSVYCHQNTISSYKANISSPSCGKLIILLQYENYGAFYDTGENDFVSLNHLLFNDSICDNKEVNDFVFRTPNIKAKALSNDIYKMFIEDEIQSRDLFWRKRNDKENKQKSLYGNKIYDWKGMHRRYLTKSLFHKCLQRTDINYIGESHMRYQFDFTMNYYIRTLAVTRKHGSMSEANVTYKAMTFVNRLSQYLDDLDCSKETTIVLQTGAWDLQFFAPRAFIENEKQGKGLIHALNRLILRGCDQLVHIVFMTAMPHPYCHPGDALCIRLMNYWRNNGAIRAINRYLIENLLSLNYSELSIIDTFPILLPRLIWMNEAVCVDHFLCNDDREGLVTTTSGVALAFEVIEAICSKEIEDYKTQENLSNYIYYINGDMIQMKNITKTHYYAIVEGCLREFPNIETLESIGFIEENFREVTIHYLLEIPRCPHVYFADRKNGTLLQSYNSRSVFYMDEGLRRPMNGVNTLLSLGLDFDAVNFIRHEDLYSIPEGEILYDKENVNYLKRQMKS